MDNACAMKILEARHDLASKRFCHMIIELPELTVAICYRAARYIFKEAAVE